MPSNKHILDSVQLPLFGTITIQLTKGYETIIDAVDTDLSVLKWFTQSNRCGRYYAYRHIEENDNQRIGLHQVILERILGRKLDKHEFPDHIDNDSLNNRRNNLRLASKSQNGLNRGKQSNNLSGFKGVSYRAEIHKWYARIQIDGKQRRLGYFDTPEAAHKAYQEAANQLHGEFARFD